MKNKELLDKFIDDNFDRKLFKIQYVDDFIVRLTDEKGDTLTLFTMRPDCVVSSINGVHYLNYHYGFDLFGDRVWYVI